jgi:hypothetical protein
MFGSSISGVEVCVAQSPMANFWKMIWEKHTDEQMQSRYICT